MNQIVHQTTIGNVDGNNNSIGNTIYNYNHFPPITLHDIESMTGESGTLRACLKSEEQAYIPLDDSWVAQQLATLITNKTEPHISKPLVIKGFGGLGKTRLALEICRLAKTQYQAKTLLLNNANADLTQLITEAKQQKQHLILLIDYLEYFTKANQNGYSFDSLRQNLHDSGEGWVHLVLTTRYLPNQTGFPRNGLSSYERLGAETLTATYCHILDLTAKTYQEWRIKVCETIYTRSKEQNIDNPLIATLLNYWEKRETTLSLPNTEELRQDNGWLLRHLCHEFRSELHNTKNNGEYELTYLLLLFPFNQKIHNQISEKYPHLEKWLEALERTGLVHCHEQSDDSKWELGHDLLADIAFSEFLLQYTIPRQRDKQVTKLLTDAQKISHNLGMIVSLLRALIHKSRLNRGFGDVERENDLKTYKIIVEQIGKEKDDEIRLFTAEVVYYCASIKDKQENDSSLYLNVWKQFGQDTHDKIRLLAALAALGYAETKSEQENDSSLYLNVWKQFGQDTHDKIRLLAALAAFGYAAIKSEQENDFSLYLTVWEQFGKDSYDEIRFEAARAAWNYALGKHKYENDFSIYPTVWEQFGQDTHDEIRLQAANAVCNYAVTKSEQENDFSFFLTVWEQFGKDKYDEIRVQAATAGLNYAVEKYKQENDLSFYLKFWEQFGQDTRDEIRLLAAKILWSYATQCEQKDEIRLLVARTIFDCAVEKYKQENDFSFFLTVWEQFGKDKYDEIRVQAATAGLNYAVEKYKQENDLSFYLKFWEQFGQDTRDEIRLLAATAAWDYAVEKYKQENDFSLFLTVWKQFGQDTHDEIRLQAAQAALVYALKKHKQENDSNPYLTVWKQFGQDTRDEIRLLAATAAWDYAVEKYKQKNDFSIYLTVWEQFGKDKHDEIRLLAAQAAFGYAATKSEQENDFSFYLKVWEQFNKDKHDEIRLQAAKAAFNYALGKYEQENDLSFYPAIWQQFENEEYLPIQQQTLSAKLHYIAWQIALGQAETAYQNGLVLFNHPLLDKNNNAGLHFLLWLAQPTPETQQACENAIASLNGEAIGWKFDEFAERISSFSDENQAYAKRIIQLLEQGNK